MGSRTAKKIYVRRIETLVHREGFLKERLANYKGKNSSYTQAELIAISWVLNFLEDNYEKAILSIKMEEPSNEQT